MPLINCEINLMLTWSTNGVMTDSRCVGTFAITDAKLYVLVVKRYNRLSGQLTSGFKQTVNRSKCQLKVSTQAQNQYLDYVIDLSFQGANRIFLLFKDDVHQRYFLPKVEIKDYNVAIDGWNLFGQPVTK